MNAADFIIGGIFAVVIGFPIGVLMGVLLIPIIGVEPGPTSNLIVYIVTAMAMVWAAMVASVVSAQARRTR